MAIRPNGTIRRQFKTLFNLGTIGELTDGQLLERFATRGGETAELAFAALVERHGPMVLRVCRNSLRDPNDVQDAFQTTFLVLVQKSRSLWVRDSLGPWLHRVAHRVATRARYSAARRQKHERQAAAARQTLVSERGDWDERRALLHEEIDRLPERYRVPVVICDLQGLSHEKAARHLGWPVGTVKSRLARARELLRERLTRRDRGMPAGLLIAEKGLGGACKAVEVVLPGTLVDSTVQAAVRIAAGKALGVGVISTRVAILIEEVLKTMFLTKLKLATAVVLVLGAAGAAGVLAQQRAGSVKIPAPDQFQKLTPEFRQAQGVDSPPVPAYITESRSLIITRLEEEAAEARARLDRALQKVGSPADPAVVHARKTFEDLQQRLDRIDQVLVDVVERYPTMVDFSGGPADVTSSSKSGSSSSPARSDRIRTSDRAVWAKHMYDKGYVSRLQLDAALENSRKADQGAQASQPQSKSPQGENPDPQQGPGNKGEVQGSAAKSQQGNPQNDKNKDRQDSGQGKQGYPQNDQGQDRRNASQGHQGDQPQDKSHSPDGRKSDGGTTGTRQQE